VRAILLTLLLTACASSQHISQFDLTDEQCVGGWEEFTWNGVTKKYHLSITSDIDTIRRWCDGHMACATYNEDIAFIFVAEHCESYLGHELSHVFGISGVDRPQVGLYKVD
jgi:hypothetical protein